MSYLPNSILERIKRFAQSLGRIFSGRTDPVNMEIVSVLSNRPLTDLLPAQSFSVDIMLQNTGELIWNDGYIIAHSDELLPQHKALPNPWLGETSSYRLGQLVEQANIEPNATVTITMPFLARETLGDFASHWQLRTPSGRPFGETIFIRGKVVASQTETPSSFGIGMNINPDQPVSNPVDAGQLAGCRWVRYPFKAAAKRRDLPDAFAEYDGLVEAYSEQGIGSIFVLNQETVWGAHAPWGDNAAGSWDAYIEELAENARKIAQQYAAYGDKVAFQIWNEGDNPRTPWVSIFVPPEKYALMLTAVSTAIRSASPESPIIAMGVSTGPTQAVNYLKEVERSLKKVWPVDALACHPYGRYFTELPFSDWGFGSLDDYLALFKKNFPDMPIWISEIGVPGHSDPIVGEENLAGVGRYMRDIFNGVAINYREQVPVVVWFAWSDLMDNAGIVDGNGNEKGTLKQTFKLVRETHTRII